MPEPIQAKVFQEQNTVALARKLVGCVLVRRLPDGREVRSLITETEAYHGESDRACHASKGRTTRTDVLYRAGGVWYVYLCYGIHEMLNLVTGPEGFPAAVLIRATQSVSGPGRLTKALGIDRALNGLPAAPESGLWIEEGARVTKKRIQVTPRIGIDYAGDEWRLKPWRFLLAPDSAQSASKATVAAGGR